MSNLNSAIELKMLCVTASGRVELAAASITVHVHLTALYNVENCNAFPVKAFFLLPFKITITIKI